MWPYILVAVVIAWNIYKFCKTPIENTSTSSGSVTSINMEKTLKEDASIEDMIIYDSQNNNDVYDIGHIDF